MKTLHFLLITIGSILAQSSVLNGKVFDSHDKEILVWTHIKIMELNRWQTAGLDATYQFSNLPYGEYTLLAQRIGYEDFYARITVSSSIKEFDIYMHKKVLHANEMLVTADKTDDLNHVAIRINEKKLRQQLSSTLAETMSHENGLSQRTMGPAPARPVMRGLGGDRLLITEDGSQTGDLSSIASDHALTIEPLNIKQIEVIRGPKSLLFGSNTNAGVINVIREYIISEKLKSSESTASAQSETVSNLLAFSAGTMIPFDMLQTKIDFAYRKSHDFQSAKSQIKNTSVQTLTAAIGASYHHDWGYYGNSLSIYRSNYGIPPYKGHLEGVRLYIDKIHTESELTYRRNLFFLNELNLSYSFTNYFHEERITDQFSGVDFGVVTHHFNLKTKFNGFGESEFKSGIELRDFASGFSFTPDSKEQLIFMAIYDDYIYNSHRLAGSVRYDFKTISPKKQFRDNEVGWIRERLFSDLSFALSYRYFLNDEWSSLISIIRTFRPPNLEEVFSRGPHFSSYGFEIGNAEISSENGLTTEWSFEYRSMHDYMKLTLFQMTYKNYLYLQKTNQVSNVNNNLLIYRYLNNDVIMKGYELSYQWHLTEEIDFAGHFNYVTAQLSLSNSTQYLPQIPPFKWNSHLDYILDEFEFSYSVDYQDAQTKLGLNETMTPSSLIHNLSIQYHFFSLNIMNSITLNFNNIFNSQYYNHLNQIKDILPEAGFNFRALYRIYF